MSWRDQTKRASKRRKRRPLFHCGRCGKRHSNPLGHVCTGGGGLTRKRAAAAKRQKTAGRRAKETTARRARRAKEEESRRGRRVRERQAVKARAAKARWKKAPARRPGRPAHDYRNCRDADCERVACEAYREGWADKPPEVIYVGGK